MYWGVCVCLNQQLAYFCCVHIPFGFTTGCYAFISSYLSHMVGSYPQVIKHGWLGNPPTVDDFPCFYDSWGIAISWRYQTFSPTLRFRHWGTTERSQPLKATALRPSLQVLSFGVHGPKSKSRLLSGESIGGCFLCEDSTNPQKKGIRGNR